MVVMHQNITDDYSLFCGDCCEVLPELPNESIGFVIFSPPFSDLFSYSDSSRDMGNSQSYDEFFQHFEFLVEQLHRLSLPGRIVAVHCMDLPTFKRSDEGIGIRDFPGDIIRSFQKNDFVYHSRHCIWKDPLIAATRTKAIGLAHKQIVKDSAMCRTGIADYIVSFRKKGENTKPISHINGLTKYYGAKSIPKTFDKFIDYVGKEIQSTNKRSQWIWQQYASPVWDDIRQSKVLTFRQARENDDEKHICPLQTDVVERCMELWSAKGDVILTPFMGVGTEIYVAVKNERKGVGIELKESYYKQAKTFWYVPKLAVASPIVNRKDIPSSSGK